MKRSLWSIVTASLLAISAFGCTVADDETHNEVSEQSTVENESQLLCVLWGADAANSTNTCTGAGIGRSEGQAVGRALSDCRNRCGEICHKTSSECMQQDLQ